jgi:hypothetical protein
MKKKQDQKEILTEALGGYLAIDRGRAQVGTMDAVGEAVTVVYQQQQQQQQQQPAQQLQLSLFVSVSHFLLHYLSFLSLMDCKRGVMGF